MDPIGASNEWQWHGYRTSHVELDGKTMQSVSGGGHWGGGLWMSSRDLARFGYLFLRRGEWAGRRLLSEQWINRAWSAGELEPRYGYMWWLNTEYAMWPTVPPRSVAALGGGDNVVWIYPERELLVVVRWIERDSTSEFLQRVVSAIRE